MVSHSRLRYAQYEAFMLQHREAVWSACWRFAKGNRARCEDMVQEVWIALWLKFDGLHSNYTKWQQRVWVKRVARSVLVDLYRRSVPSEEHLTDTMIAIVRSEVATLADDIDDMLATLPYDEEKLMRMRLEGYDASEIAEEFGINRNAVYQRVNRVLTKLRESHGIGL